MIEKEQVLHETALKIMRCFHKLVMEKDFTKLTVAEICEATQVSRKTFYKYFKDKNDVVEQMLIKEIIVPMENLRELYINMDLPSAMILEWQYQQIYKDRKFYERVNAFTGQNSFYEFVLKHSSEIISKKLQPLKLSDLEHEYMTYFYASSHTMLLVKWMKDGMMVPPKLMASYYERWTLPIFQNYDEQSR
ncbi:TetR/AcrR family transcriptional regulator [Caryophanon tenue]|uniref:HTH tetR-type domain-containing protein n=1 Tax=Caryophanon tenue TaxID=33978 RepID=A0A1C0YCM7_9BACL|nr:TetR/AcrR family transcriptional regulator [Caryophanon tenue]OCS84901.1 hypothetical protein A6M13_14470 [Caryophanon tenue]